MERRKSRYWRKLVTTSLDLYHFNVANVQVMLCTELLTSCVLHFMRSNPSKETIHNFLMMQTQFNLTDDEWIKHQQYMPSMVQYEVRQRKNEIVAVETIAEQLTNYDELSNKDKMRKYRLHLHAFFGAKTGLEISKVIVSYFLVFAFILFMSYYVSRVTTQ